MIEVIIFLGVILLVYCTAYKFNTVYVNEMYLKRYFGREDYLKGKDIFD